MKRNSLLNKIREVRAKYIDIFIDNSFDLSARIQYLMELNGIDQKELAKRLNKNESEISKWMSGSHNYTLKTLAKIEEVLGYKLLSVCSEEDYKTKTEFVFISRESFMNHVNVDKSQIHNPRKIGTYKFNTQKVVALNC